MLIAGSEHQVLAVPPRVVAETRLEFRRTALEFLEHVMRRHASRVILDMRQTTEVDASGLGVLVLLQKRARERMIATTLFRAPPSVKQMLQLTKLDYLFELED